MKLRKIMASLAAAVIVSTAAVIPASAYSSTVAGFTVNYSSSISSSYATSTSSISADPTANTLVARISGTFVYRNTSTGVSERDTKSSSGNGGCGVQYKAPSGCEMKSVSSSHDFKINGVFKQLYSAASR